MYNAMAQRGRFIRLLDEAPSWASPARAHVAIKNTLIVHALSIIIKLDSWHHRRRFPRRGRRVNERSKPMKGMLALALALALTLALCPSTLAFPDVDEGGSGDSDWGLKLEAVEYADNLFGVYGVNDVPSGRLYGRDSIVAAQVDILVPEGTTEGANWTIQLIGDGIDLAAGHTIYDWAVSYDERNPIRNAGWLQASGSELTDAAVSALTSDTGEGLRIWDFDGDDDDDFEFSMLIFGLLRDDEGSVKAEINKGDTAQSTASFSTAVNRATAENPEFIQIGQIRIGAWYDKEARAYILQNIDANDPNGGYATVLIRGSGNELIHINAVDFRSNNTVPVIDGNGVAVFNSSTNRYDSTQTSSDPNRIEAGDNTFQIGFNASGDAMVRQNDIEVDETHLNNRVSLGLGEGAFVYDGTPMSVVVSEETFENQTIGSLRNAVRGAPGRKDIDPNNAILVTNYILNVLFAQMTGNSDYSVCPPVFIDGGFNSEDTSGIYQFINNERPFNFSNRVLANPGVLRDDDTSQQAQAVRQAAATLFQLLNDLDDGTEDPITIIANGVVDPVYETALNGLLLAINDYNQSTINAIAAAYAKKASSKAMAKYVKEFIVDTLNASKLMNTKITDMTIHQFANQSPAILFTTQPQDIEVAAGGITARDTLTAAAIASASGNVALNWYECDSAGAIRGGSLASGGTLRVPVTLAPGAHHFLCRATYPGAKDASSKVAKVTVRGAPTLQITSQPADQRVVVGKTATFAVTAVGEGLAYQWYVDRGDGRGWRTIPGATDARHTTPAVRLDSDGDRFHCVVTDRHAHSLTTRDAVLRVTTAPKPPLTGDDGRPFVWLSLCLLGMGALVGLRPRRRRA